jgi:hypothetical protein
MNYRPHQRLFCSSCANNRCSTERFQICFLHHKLEAIKYVNEQIKDPNAVTDDGTVAAVASLALVEVRHVLQRLVDVTVLNSLPERDGVHQRSGITPSGPGKNNRVAGQDATTEEIRTLTRNDLDVQSQSPTLLRHFLANSIL